MPRSTWSVAGDEIQGFNKYLDQRGDQQTRADQQGQMVELRKQSMLNQMQNQERQAQRALADDEYRASQQAMQERRFKRDDDRDALKMDAEKQRDIGRAKLGELIQGRMSTYGEEGHKPINDQEFGMMSFQAGAHPDDARAYHNMFKGGSNSNKPVPLTPQEKFDWWKKQQQWTIDNKPVKPETPTDTRTADQKFAQSLDRNDVLDMQTDKFIESRNLRGYSDYNYATGQGDTRVPAGLATVKDLNKKLRTYELHGATPYQASQEVIMQEVATYKSNNGIPEDTPLSRDVIRGIADRVLKARN